MSTRIVCVRWPRRPMTQLRSASTHPRTCCARRCASGSVDPFSGSQELFDRGARPTSYPARERRSGPLGGVRGGAGERQQLPQPAQASAARRRARARTPAIHSSLVTADQIRVISEWTRRPVSLRTVIHDGREDTVAVEEPLEIRVDGEPIAVTMRTPGHDEELALGLPLRRGSDQRPAGRRADADLANNTIVVTRAA